MDELTHNILEWGGVSGSGSHQTQQSLIVLMVEVTWIGHGGQLQKQM